MSSFGPATFDWDFAQPKWEIKDGAPRYSGPIIVYTSPDLDLLRALRRPCTTRVAGDPSVGGTVYVDYFGPDPSQTLTMEILVAWADATAGAQAPYAGGDHPDPVPQPVTYTAILNEITRGRAMPGGVHMCDIEFVLLSEPVPI